MSKLSQTQKIVEFLKQYPNERFNARQIAEQITSKYPEDYQEKKANPRFLDDKAFISQVVAEIGSQKDQIISIDKNIGWQDKPRPRVYWYSPQSLDVKGDIALIDKEDDIQDENHAENLAEKDLYPILIEYLRTELRLFCLRIDEKKSKNMRGAGGNQWLHPDIVAMQPVDKEWNELVRHCVKQGGGQSVRLWSFEVKKELNSSNVRKSFFRLSVTLVGQMKAIWWRYLL